MGNLSDSLLHAEKDAAYHALLFLQQTVKLQVRDYNYLLITKIRQLNRRVLAQQLTMASEIQTLLNAWEKMTIQLYASSNNVEDTLLSYFSPDPTGPYSCEIHTILSHIKQLTRSIQNSTHASLTKVNQFDQQYFNLYRCLSSDENSVGLQTPELHRMAVVALSPKFMFTEMMTAAQLPMPTYTHIEIYEDEYASCIEFYPNINLFIQDGPRQKICGFAPASQQAAEEAAALQAIGYMESEAHMQLQDFNYANKENALDEHRSLLKKTEQQTKAMKIISKDWNTAMNEFAAACDLFNANVIYLVLISFAKYSAILR
ncbi:uncharacterized protein LOC133890184 [Phragmites australis]|uniref:uncharacterized protein LOC133890184 n=1 Tax=Phragmites australis TaxID=29695 RepID=UPI002D793763|nr:uncharacterized protein LOC133890184 [Phragmites australis]